MNTKLLFQLQNHFRNKLIEPSYGFFWAFPNRNVCSLYLVQCSQRTPVLNSPKAKEMLDSTYYFTIQKKKVRRVVTDANEW